MKSTLDVEKIRQVELCKKIQLNEYFYILSAPSTLPTQRTSSNPCKGIGL